MSAAAPSSPDGLLSVGRVSAETGITPDTLRVWERRYGAPVPVRLPSGHRRYTQAQVSWLRRVAEGLALGHRPARLVAASEAQLERLIAEARPETELDPRVAGWLGLVERSAGAELAAALRAAAVETDTIDLLDGAVGPLLRAVGEAWARGALDVRHEHLAAQVVEDFLRGERARAAAARGAPRGRFLLATLADELHELGLLMAALVSEERGVATELLGPSSPLEQIVAAARETGVDAVLVSVALSGAGNGDRRLAELRDALPEAIRLVAGGEGVRRVRRKRRDVLWFAELAPFARWVERGSWRRSQ